MIIALDFGGTKLTASACLRGQTEWLAHQRTYSPRGSTARTQYDSMLNLVESLLTQTDHALHGIGVSFGGPVETHTGVTKLSYHIPGWENLPLVSWLETEFSVPIVMDNDANAGALGEYRFGAGRGCQDMLYLTVSTGIGGGWILGGQLYRGADGLAGEMGHTRIKPEPGGLPWNCGEQSCLEAEASGLAIAHRARFYLQKHKKRGTHLRTLLDDDWTNLTAKLVNQAARAGDKLSQTVLTLSGQQLGRGLAQAITLLNPARVVLGGGVTQSGEAWWQAVHETTRQNVPETMPIEIVPAQLGDDAPLWGAVSLLEDVL